MKYTLILLAGLAVVLSSCSTAYRAAQTPDDVYYSPAKEKRAYYASGDRYQERINSQDDRYLRMKVRDRYRWDDIDDFSYWNDSRFYYNNVYFNNPNWMYNRFNPAFAFNGFGNPFLFNNGFAGYNVFSPSYYYGFGNFYSPVYTVVYYKNPRVYTGVTGKSNLATYVNTRYANNNYYGNFKTPSQQPAGFSDLMRRVLAPTPANNSNNSSNNNSYERPARTFSTPSSGSNSAGGRSGGYNSSGSSSGSSRPPRN